VENKQMAKEELDKSANDKSVKKKKKKKGEEEVDKELISTEASDNIEEASESFWSENGLLIGGGVLATIGGVAIVSGGSSNSSSGVTLKDTSSTSISVQDGKISGAMVFTDGNNNGKIDFTDANNNNLYDLGETLLGGDAYIGTTNSNGDISVSSTLISGKTLMTQGGTDITTGLAVTVSYTATSGSSIINPLTTVVQELISQGKTETEAQTLVKNALGLDSSINLSTYDPTKDSSSNSLAVQKAAVQIANLLTIATNITGVTSGDALSAFASLLNSTGELDLTNSSTISAILTQTLSNAGLTTTFDSNIAIALANANSLINESTTLENVVSIQKVVQSDISTAVKNNDTESILELTDKDNITNTAKAKEDTTAPNLTLSELTDTVLGTASEQENYSQSYTVSDENFKSITALVKDSNGNEVSEITFVINNGIISGDLSSLSTGSYTIEVTATDYAGNKTIKTQSIGIGEVTAIIIDDISSKYINAIEDDSNITISGSSLGMDSGAIITLTLNNKLYTAIIETNGKWSTSISSTDIKSLSQGVNTLEASSSDAPSVSSSFIYDTTAPTLIIATNPNSADSKAASSFAYSYAVSDVDSGVASVSATIVESSGISLTASNGVVKGDISSLTKGLTYTLQLTAIDEAGNTSIKTQTFTYNTTTSPTPVSLSSLNDVILNSTEASNYSQYYSWTSGSKVSTTAKIYDATTGTEITNVSITAASNYLKGDLSLLSDGVYKIVVKANYFNGEEIVYKEQLITIDKSAPTLTLETLEDTTLSSVSEIAEYSQSYVAIDTNGQGIKNIIITIKNEQNEIVETITKTDSYGTLSGILESLASGTYTIEVKATDIAGNSITKTQSITLESIVDIEAPTVVITDNIESETAKGDITYSFTFSEAVSGFSIEDVTVLNGTKGEFIQVNAYTYTLIVSPTSSTIGDLTVSIAANVAQDSSGNDNIASVVAMQHFNTQTESVAPTLILASQPIAADSKVAASFAYSFSASDESGIDTITAILKNSDGTEQLSGVSLLVGNNGIVTGNLSSLSSGTYTIELTATDVNGNSTTKSETFTYNTSSSHSSVVLEQLLDNTYNKEEAANYTQHVSWAENTSRVSTTIIVKDSNGSTVDSVNLSLDTSTKIISGDLSSLSDGTYIIEVTANYREGQDIVVREQMIVIDSSAVTTATVLENYDLFSSDVSSVVGVSANSSAYYTEFADYDGDGDLDMFIGSNSSSAESKLYSNNADGTFTDVTSSTIGSIKMSMGGATWVDYDNDGDMDLVLAGGSSSTATKVLNNNHGVFTDVATTAGIITTTAIKSVKAIDYDGDGDTDLYFTSQSGVNYLYSNNNDGTFTDVTTIAGIGGNTTSQDQESLWADFDNDGDLDLFVAVNNASGAYSNSKYYTNNGDGTFTDNTIASLGDVSMTLLDASMADYDGDGDMDIFLAGNVASSKLLQNDGTGNFTNVALSAGVAGISSEGIYASEFVDINGDGKPDLITIGDNATHVYINQGNGTFKEELIEGLTTTVSGRDILGVDYDNDGDNDLITISNSGSLVNIYENLINDTSNPIVTITDNTSGTAYSDIVYTFTFNENITGFDASDITVTNGSIDSSTFTKVSDRVYTIVIIPNDESTSAITVDVAANTFTDLKGNDNIAAIQPIQEVNTLNAYITITDNTANTATENVTFTFTFNEDVTGFDIDDVTVSNGTKGTFTVVSPSIYTLVVTPLENSTGNISISVAANSATDGTNGNIASAIYTQAYNTDITAPELIITDNVSEVDANGNIIFTFTFNEIVTGFAIGDITVSNGSKGSFVTVESGRIYTLVVSPISNGEVSVTVAANVLADLGSNGNIEVTATQNYVDIGMINTANLGDDGYVITGSTLSSGRLGYSVSNAGDVNGDGLADVVVGAYRETTGNTSGAVYVLFGKTDTATIDVSNLGNNGYKIYNSDISSRVGTSVTSLGDINNDGLSDLLISGATTNGRAYVVYGKTDTSEVDLANLTALQGFSMTGTSDVTLGKWVTAGDIDGDGINDIMVSAASSSSSVVSSVYIVFGKSVTSKTSTIDLTKIVENNQGIIITDTSGTYLGYSISYVGDTNGDGLGDILVSAPYTKNETNTDQQDGAVYLIYGTETAQNIDVSNLTEAQGYKITGPIPTETTTTNVRFGYYTGYAGDVNGDGNADMIIGSSNSATYGYKAYVVFGKDGIDVTNVDITSLEANGTGFVIESGVNLVNGLGSSVSYAGDINGDGFDDLIVGASSATITNSSGTSVSNVGESYIIFGGSSTMTTLDFLGTSDNDILTGTSASETAVLGAGDDIYTANGGADVIYAGAGNDTIILNADNIAKLEAGVTDNKLSKIDGGSGTDTIALSGSGITFDLTKIDNILGLDSRITSIEKIDLTGTGDNILTLSLADVLDINNEKLLTIDGDSGDSVNLLSTDGWTKGTSITVNENIYSVYTMSTAELRIDADATVTII
jgi:hypothetical protein